MQPTRLVMDAIDRLFLTAMRDTGQARKVAKFLMWWGNEPALGGFDLAHIRSLDTEISDDMWILLKYLFASGFKYPIDIGFEDKFVALVRLYRPDLFDRKVFHSAAGEPDGDANGPPVRRPERQSPRVRDLSRFLDHNAGYSLAFYLPKEGQT